MRIQGLHHITCITADGPANAEFYVGVLGLRLVKKTVNFDVPDAYHLYYGDDLGRPGSIFTFFEYPNAERGRPGAGMIHRVVWRVGSERALDYWRQRLSSTGTEAERREGSLLFADGEGLGHELVVDRSGDPPLVATAGPIPEEHRIIGLHGARAYARDPQASRDLLADTLGFERGSDDAFVVRGEERSASYRYDPAPERPGVQAAGTVHHIAWACARPDQEAWRQRTIEAGAETTEILDRKYFTSIYFREPSGVLFGIATLGSGFTVDEPADALGQSLRLPPWHEHLRARLETSLRPIRATQPGLAARRTA